MVFDKSLVQGNGLRVSDPFFDAAGDTIANLPDRGEITAVKITDEASEDRVNWL